VMARHVGYLGDLQWDFSRLVDMQIAPEFVGLIEDYLQSVLNSRQRIGDGKFRKPH